MGQKRPVSIEGRPFLGLQHNSRKSGQILPFRVPKGQMGQKRSVQLTTAFLQFGAPTGGDGPETAVQVEIALHCRPGRC